MVLSKAMRKTVLILSCCVAFVTMSGCCVFHSWQEATCTEPKTCEKCGKTEGEPLGHSWVEATCTEPKTCSVCGLTEGEALGHTLGEWVVDKAATCGEEGSKHSVCSVCGETITESIAVTLPHTVNDWVVDKAATCTEDGTRSGTCSVCGQRVSEKINKKGHSPGDWTVSKAATYNTSGEKQQKCTVCGAVINTQEYSLTDAEKESYFISNCISPSYEEVARYPDNYKGKYAMFTGEVIQVLEENGYYNLRVNVSHNGYFWTDTIYVTYTRKNANEGRILEDDIITVYGIMDGMYSYEATSGATITIPLLKGIYVY